MIPLNLLNQCSNANLTLTLNTQNHMVLAVYMGVMRDHNIWLDRMARGRGMLLNTLSFPASDTHATRQNRVTCLFTG